MFPWCIDNIAPCLIFVNKDTKRGRLRRRRIGVGCDGGGGSGGVGGGGGGERKETGSRASKSQQQIHESVEVQFIKMNQKRLSIDFFYGVSNRSFCFGISKFFQIVSFLFLQTQSTTTNIQLLHLIILSQFSPFPLLLGQIVSAQELESLSVTAVV
jgi:hypothetical protein